MFDCLVKCPVFKGLQLLEIEDLINSVPHIIKNFEKDEIIAKEDDEVRNLHIILKGSVKGEMTDLTGRSIKIEDIESPRPLAPAFLFGMQNKYPVTIITNESVTVLSIPKSSFVVMMQKNEFVLQNFLDSVSGKAQFLSDKIKFLTFQSLKGKIARYILELATTNRSANITMQHSQAELAEMFGVARPSLTRTIREMHDEEIIQAEGKNIFILDIYKLRSFLK